MDIKKLHKQLERARESYDQAIAQLAERIRKEVIAPACLKYDLFFVNEADDFYFCNPQFTEFYDREIAEQRKMEDIVEAYDLLGRPIDSKRQVGHYVETYEQT